MVPDAEFNEEIEALRGLLARSERIVALTGAGSRRSPESPISAAPAASGRAEIKPITYQDFVASEEARLEDWRRRFRMNEDFCGG